MHPVVSRSSKGLVPDCPSQPLCSLSHTATNLDLDPDLVERALALSGAPTKKAAVTAALQEFIARREQRGLLELFGKLEWEPGYDYKRERSRD